MITVLRDVLIILGLLQMVLLLTRGGRNSIRSTITTAAAVYDRLGRVLKVIRLAPFHKHVNQHGPGTFAIIVGHVIVDLNGEVQQQVPRISGNGPFVVLL